MNTQPQTSPAVQFAASPRVNEPCMRLMQRHATRAVRCNLGEVVDLSISGARIRANSNLRSPIDVQFYAMNKSITIRAKVAWARATGEGFRADVGLVFPKLTRLEREMIESLARGHMHRALI